MGRQLQIQLIGEDGVSDLGTLQSGEVRVGREPGANGIVIDRDGLSRVHGSFVRIQSHWLYRDNGSTNGSWINGRKVGENKWGIVRSGTIVQLADVGLRILEVGDGGDQQSLKNFPALGGRCVLVFKHGEFLEEYPVPEYGKALTIGGADADLPLEGDLADAPALVIERRGDGVVVYSIAKTLPLFVNGEEIHETRSVPDGSEIELEEYSILFSDPGSVAGRQQPGLDVASVSSTFVRGWEEIGFTPGGEDQQAKVTASGVFGTGEFGFKSSANDGMSEDDGDGDSRFLGRRTAALNRPKVAPSSYASVEEKIILGVGLCVVFAVMLLLIWWLIQ